MRVSVVLLWFCLSCVHLQRGDDQLAVEDVERSGLNANQTSVQPDVWTELRDLRDMVVEQRVQLQLSQRQIEELKKETTGLNNRLMVSESQVEKLKQDNEDTNKRLLACENQVEEVKVENSAMNSRLLASENHVEDLKRVTSALEGRVVSTELGVEGLREENANRPKVAFSFASGLNGYLGPFNVVTILVFRKEITNIGNAYSPITGVFTAPLRGVYYFRFSLFNLNNSNMMSAILFKNEEFILFVSERPEGSYEYVSNAVSLLLEKGDLVYIKLASDRQVYDDSNNHCIFSGFLLFPV
ncbi:uncharacterized protein LOC118824556 [Colossoma macropomum]|uniref:uncharacterized protein LOC118824556 n=1 Tax=Colossoma macropomum TaxID=42526 RepID=UPI001863D58E|nr:uncharacterized protein LOC118824556 [Colossoma macropomum]